MIVILRREEYLSYIRDNMTVKSFQTINHVGINKDGTSMDIWMQLYVTGIRGYRGEDIVPLETSHQ